MTHRYARNPGADSIAKWKQALSASKRQQRQRRGRHAGDVSIARTGPGMMRRGSPRVTADPGDAEPGGENVPVFPICTERDAAVTLCSCPARFREKPRAAGHN